MSNHKNFKSKTYCVARRHSSGIINILSPCGNKC